MTSHATHWVRHGLLSLLITVPMVASALTASQVFDKVKDSVLVVKAFDARGNPVSQGSGVMVPSGSIVTNCHVLEAGARYQVGKAKHFVPAILRAEDTDKDLCLLEARGAEFKPATLGKAKGLKVGDVVYAVGSPQGLELSLSDGIVSQLRGGSPPFIQTTAAISPGSSGGGLFDSDGRLVGITSFYLEGGQGLNFALPVEWLAEVKPAAKIAKRERSRGEWLARAADLSEKGDAQGLLEWSRQWTRSDPDNAMAWMNLGSAYGALGNHANAIESYRRALTIQPEEAFAWIGLGLAYSELGRHTDAIDAHRQALRFQPDNAYAWLGLGRAYSTGLDRQTDAIEAYRNALRFQPDLANAWLGLGLAYGQLKRYADAIESYRQALRIQPDHAPTWYVLGRAYSGLDRHADAIEAYRQAQRIRPHDADTWHSLGVAYGQLGRHADAIESYRQALSIRPDHVDAWTMLALEYALSGNRAEALTALQQLRRYAPERADKLFNLLVPR